MAITRQDIVDAYNSIYFSVNGRNRTYEELRKEELEEALLILLNNRTTGGSGGGGSTDVSALLKEGTPITDETLESGGTSALGWFSSIRKSINNIWNLLNGGNQKTVVRNIVQKFREDFAGSNLNSSVWEVVQQGTEQTIIVNNSELTISSGTTSNAETIIRSLVGFTIPMIVMFTARLSQRIANQEFYLEITDSSGLHVARLIFTGTSNNIAAGQTVNEGSSLPSTNLIVNNTLSHQIFEIDAGIDNIDFYCRASDTTGIRGSATTKTRFIPDPNKTYFLQVRAKNLTSPASNTDFIIDSITCQDVEELTTKISGGNGGGGVNSSVPVLVMNGTTSVQVSSSLPSGSSAIGDVGIQYRSNATGAASSAIVISGASTNPTVVKASAGRVIGFSLLNTATSPRYLKMHNTSTTPTAGSGVNYVIPLPVGLNNFNLEGGIGSHSTGIAYTITANPATSDTTTIGANEVVGTLFFS